MKHILIFLTILAFGFTQAQPQKVNYQAVALTAGGQTVKNQAIKLRLSIVDSSATGTVLYTETHQPTTDGAGQFSVFVGGGIATVGTFSNIAWSNGKDKFLKAEADVTGGTNYVLMGTSQIVSVPYAIAAGSLTEGATITGANGSQYTLTVGSGGPTWNLTNPNVNFSCGQSVIYAGESYPTVQIGTQCWFRNNLNVGVIKPTWNLIDSQRNDGIVEKYCWGNQINYCQILGGLYQWGEAIQYKITNANNNSHAITQGICPLGWHIPSDNEFCILENYLDTNTNCFQFGWSGNTIGIQLKSASGLWATSFPSQGSNSSGFSAEPHGYRDNAYGFINKDVESSFWTSTQFQNGYSYGRFLRNQSSQIARDKYDNNYGFSVRCLKD